MKLAPLLLFPFLIAGSAQAYESQPGWSSSRKCIRKEYREEYVPGTANSPGYVKSWHDTIEVPCRPWRSSPPREREPRPIYQRPPSPDGNECSDGAVLGGILGGGAAAALSQEMDVGGQFLLE